MRLTTDKLLQIANPLAALTATLPGVIDVAGL